MRSSRLILSGILSILRHENLIFLNTVLRIFVKSGRQDGITGKMPIFEIYP